MKMKTYRAKYLALFLLLFGGTVAAQTPEHVLIHGNVFGGGKVAEVNGSVMVNLDGSSHVMGDVYGGGALADVNFDEEEDSTVVNIKGGTVDSNIYGGGLGDTVTPAMVKGKVHVNIGQQGQASNNVVIGGSVFGCNNVKGSPLTDVRVDIWKTAHTEGVNDTAHSSSSFAILAVYGGGNRADYEPALVVPPHITTVHIHGCDNTIQDVYGGGNAAAVSGAMVEVDGGKFDRIFAGGNGAGDDNPGADIGNRGTTLRVHAGLIRQLFGGSNERGVINGPVSVTVDHPETACDVEEIEEFYGGGNLAPITGDLSTTIACGVGKIDNLFGGANQAEITGDVALTVQGGTITNVYGGANNANITGNVTLNLQGGTIINAYGGNNAGGTVSGIITVNIDSNRTDCPLFLDNVYGGGNNAPNSKEGYPSPRVYFNCGTVRHDVFGSGKGTGAVVTANPLVVIGNASSDKVIVGGNVYGGGLLANVTGNPEVQVKRGRVFGNVFAAGKGNNNVNTAAVTGNTILTVSGGQVDSNIYGGGELASVKGSGLATVTVSGGTIGKDSTIGHVFGSGLGQSKNAYKNHAYVQSSKVHITGGTIRGSVFGGGENGHVKNNTDVVVSGGTIGDSLTAAERTGSAPVYHGNVYGGGRGIGASVHEHAGWVEGNTKVTVRGGTIWHNIYGGGSMASVGSHTLSGENITSYSNGLAEVYIYGGKIGSNGDGDGHVFGSSRGTAGTSYKKFAFTNRTHVVIDSMGYVRGSVFGSGENGHVSDSTFVEVRQSDSSHRVSEGYPIVGWPLTAAEHTQAADGSGVPVLHGNVYGGGRGIDLDASGKHSKTAGRVYGHTRVLMNGGRVRHNIYGGGSLASVDHGAFVTISAGSVGDSGVNEGQVYGSGRGVAASKNSEYAQMAFVDSSVVIIQGDSTYIHGSVFGGGANGHVSKNTHVYIKGGHIGDTLTAAEHRVDPMTGTSNVQVFHGNVYGGGRGVDHRVEDSGLLSTTAGCVYGNTEVVMTSGTVLHSIYGGGSLASVGTIDEDVLGNVVAIKDSTGHARVVVKGGWVGSDPTRRIDIDGKNCGRVFGSGRGMAGSKYSELAYVNDTRVIISDSAYVHGSVFGSGENGHVLDSTYVQVTGGIIGVWDTTTTRHIYTGNVYGGGRGVDHDNNGHISRTAGRVHKSTRVEISGGYIRHNVYGGGSLATVGDTTRAGYIASSGQKGRATVIVTGGRIGINGHNNGHVFGSGLGRAGSDAAGDYTGLTYVANTFVTVNYSGAASTSLSDVNVRDTANYPNRIAGSVFGSGENGHVHGNTLVKIQNGIIGTRGTYIEGNVFGGGLGTDVDEHENYSLTAGKTYGNTTVDVTGGRILHNVYGGGNMASVGSVDESGNLENGMATVNINGGIVGVDGHDNGHVFGSCRGLAGQPMSQVRNMAFVNNTSVTISGNAHVRGSAYGGGENGHTRNNAVVNINGGIIGMPYTSYDEMNTAEKRELFSNRGNVYGAGCGTDYIDENQNYSDSAGIVLGNTTINVTGGLICRNVYGGGAMASVGTVTSRSLNADLLSYPMTLTYKPGTGTATVNITGGRIGVDGKHNGDVYGSCRGKAGDRNKFAPLANVRETHVTVNYPTTANYASVTNTAPYTECIAGSVYGSGENGHTYGNTYVNIQKGLIGVNAASDSNGSVFGGGSGMGLMDAKLVRNIVGTDTTFFDTVTYSVTAGKVYGNTYVSVTGGHILHNVYGGGNLGSVGKGNYHGYGETYTDTANSGRAYVDIFGGTIGTDDDNDNGHVFGSGHGVSPRDESRTPRILYCPEFFAAYVNRTFVTIGETVGTSDSPRIWGSVFGGGENGHTRADAHVVVNNGKIGKAFTSGDPESRVWTLRGNVYGAGRGIDKYNNEYYTLSSGSVTNNTYVDINGGTIYRNVYGGGSIASVGPPAVPPSSEASACYVNINSTVGYANSEADKYGGSVYGSSRGEPATDRSNATLSKAKQTIVNINTGADVKRSVFGGGENGQVDENTDVNIQGGHVRHHVYGGGKGSYSTSYLDSISGRIHGDTRVDILSGSIDSNVYGGCRGAFIDGNTLVNVGDPSKGTATINGEIFGANNATGTPFGNSEVHIYHTAHTSANAYPVPAPTSREALDALPHTEANYAIKGVYGGGDKAAHEPTADDGTTLVYIHYCEENTVMYVFGGGNAADTKNNHIIIDGGRMYQVFGGGNGDGVGNPGADVSGRAVTEIHGGLIDQAFSGSNAKGVVSLMSLTFDDQRADGETPCDQVVGDIFNGGNHAPSGGGDLVIECGAGFLGDVYGGANAATLGTELDPINLTLTIKGGQMTRVFGGANEADIYGNITVNILGGSIDTLFGGNNSAGNINGSITVNVNYDDESPCTDTKKIDVVFGGGRNASYTPTHADGLSPNFSPTVNIQNLPSTGVQYVFGGGKGKDAEVLGNPRVVLGDESVPNGFVEVHHDVFGGGDAAPVGDTSVGAYRNPMVIMKKGTVHGTIYGGGLGRTAVVAGHPTVVVLGTSLVMGNVYGGGNAGKVLGNTDVQIGYGPEVAAPKVVRQGNAFAITTTTPEATIYYTTDGSTPTTSSSRYSTPIAASSGNSIRAIAVRPGYISSDEGTVAAPAPVISESNGNFTLSSSLAGATIHYTLDGSEPTTSSPTYSSALTPTGTQVVKAIAVKDGYTPSAASVLKLKAPRVIIEENLAYLAPQSGSTAYYSLDGSDPATPYSVGSPVELDDNLQVIQVQSRKNGYLDSDIETPAETDAPYVNINAGSGEVNIIATDDGYCTIYYTTDGSDPTTSSNVYSGPFTVGHGVTVKAIAKHHGQPASSIASNTRD